MKISKPSVVTLSWLIKDTLGEVLSELEEPTEFFVGGVDLLPKIEEALLEHEVGDELQLHLEPEHAFGDYDNKLVTFAASNLFPGDIEEGLCFESSALPTEVNNIQPNQLYTITDVYPDHLVLDANHPLAGISIRIQLKILAARAADEVELQQQSVIVDEFEPSLFEQEATFAE